MIFNLENIANLKKDRTSDDFINKILQVLKSKDSPYKNLSPNRLKNLENAIKNINRKNLEDIAMKGSYRDGLYSFINYCDDAEELLRVGNDTASFKTLFGEIL